MTYFDTVVCVFTEHPFLGLRRHGDAKSDHGEDFKKIQPLTFLNIRIL